MGQRTVLICGAGIAGPTLAYWLARHGFRPTVVERARGLRSSGSPVDVHGTATEVARRMGILPRLRDAATHAPDLAFMTASGHRIGPLRLGRPRGDDVEVPRDDLAAILCQAAADDAEFLFGDSITALRADDGGIDVIFERAAPRRFDLVVGADGLHSTVRAMAFGPAIWVSAQEAPVAFAAETAELTPLPGPLIRSSGTAAEGRLGQSGPQAEPASLRVESVFQSVYSKSESSSSATPLNSSLGKWPCSQWLSILRGFM
ncbi:FAD-dependent monooxygenase [Pseudarthrobacter sp. H2]|uniref:FAD-dependent monooxygenase n=1 Tax=Pseudarthrobacter sp. H2 TaxID=3418415 RepID=UPI003CF029D8